MDWSAMMIRLLHSNHYSALHLRLVQMVSPNWRLPECSGRGMSTKRSTSPFLSRSGELWCTYPATCIQQTVWYLVHCVLDLCVLYSLPSLFFSLVSRPHPLTRNGLVNTQIKVFGLTGTFATLYPTCNNIQNILWKTHSKKLWILEWNWTNFTTVREVLQCM